MSLSLKRITARFYTTEAGNQPVKDWIKGLSEDDPEERKDQKIIGRDIARVEFGWPQGMPVCRQVGSKGVWEVRSTIKEGKVEARVYFGIDGSDMILLHGSDDKSDQDHEIDVAEDRWKKYKERKRQAAKAKPAPKTKRK